MKAPSAGIVDYRMGNLASVSKAMEHAGFAAVVSDSPAAIADCDLVVVPGVGNFGAGMKNLTRLGLVEPLRDRAASGRPILGICLGMQLLFEWSEEGETKGLGVMPGKVVRLRGDEKVPHMGWNDLSRTSGLFTPFEGKYFYFVHSYVCVPEGPEVAAVTVYGETWASAVQRPGVVGVQFHPEKSSADGLALLGRIREVLF